MNQMGRLTETDDQGNWCLKGLPWKCMNMGEVITATVYEKIYGALCKLKNYEDTGLSPEDVDRVNDFEETNTNRLLKLLAEEKHKNEWIPSDTPPEDNDYVLLSFENFSVPLVGRYEADEEGGAYYAGDNDESCISQYLFVNAWRRLPEPYRPEGRDD